ncbi:NAD(P)H-hydrate dehydratase [Maricaulis sp. D1M11]|uniref:NAD(P)H-hydrate dehydratase n=1 Tax=Maricaulis sp. D1M11 TaxID=3076117 RepID=UPI0039B4B378
MRKYEALASLDVLDCAGAAQCDALAPTRGIAIETLMEAAGKAVAKEVVANFARCPVHVLCGPGNNGGDGYVTARILADEGWAVRVFSDAHPSRDGPAANARQAWSGEVEPFDRLLAEADGEVLIIDALFGAGLCRPLEDRLGTVIEHVSRMRWPVIAVDMPSGWSGDGGGSVGAAFRADLTVTFDRLKVGHLVEPSASAAGQVLLHEIGMPRFGPDDILPVARVNDPQLWQDHWPRRDELAHKHLFGRVLVFSGDLESSGAARLAGLASLRAGAGLVTLAGPDRALPVLASEDASLMVVSRETGGGAMARLRDLRQGAVVIGPGFGDWVALEHWISDVLTFQRHVVLDADALRLIARTPGLRSRLSDSHVLTPHEGEFDALFPGLLASSTSRFEAALTAARSLGSIIVLKGADTIIAAPQGLPVINRHAAPWLATAGSGDVLAGLIAGLYAQGMPAFEAACAAVWMHGDAALRLGEGMIASDLPRAMPQVLQALRASLQSHNAVARLTQGSR